MELLLLLLLYFVVRAAVRDGINQSALVDAKKQKEIREHEYERLCIQE